MHFDNWHLADCCTHHDYYKEYTPVKIVMGISGIQRHFTVSQGMASSLQRAHINMSTTTFEIVELNGKHHTVDLFYVEYIITL